MFFPDSGHFRVSGEKSRCSGRADLWLIPFSYDIIQNLLGRD